MGQFQKRTRLTEQQIRAIEILSTVHGMTYEQIADEVGVTSRALRNWRADDRFNAELQRAIIRNTHDRLPEIFASIPDHIIRDGNAALLRTLLQANGMLVDKQEVTQISEHGGGTDIVALRAEMQRFKARGGQKAEDGE